MIIGFDSQNYDIPLIKRFLPSALSRLDTLPSLVIKKNNRFMALRTKTLQYLDSTSYLAAGTSLRDFYKAYNVKSPKRFFPYKWFDDLQKLKATQLLSIEYFYSILTDRTISQENYQLCQDVWKEQNMKTFGDFVKYYNNLDVIGLVDGVQKLMKVKELKKQDIFKDKCLITWTCSTIFI